jgi:hypothetical protein
VLQFYPFSLARYDGHFSTTTPIWPNTTIAKEMKSISELGQIVKDVKVEVIKDRTVFKILD